MDGAKDDYEANERYIAYLLDKAWLARIQGNFEMAEQWLEEGTSRIVETLKKQPEDRNAGNMLTLASFRYWEMKQELPPEPILAMLPYYYSNSGSIRACRDASMAARKAIMLGATVRATELTTYLMEQGYRDVIFMRACRAHSLCNGQ